MFAWLPTGYGKSLYYQLLPFLFDHKLEKLLQVGSNMHIGSLYQLSRGVTSGGIDDLASAVFPSVIIEVGGDKSSGHDMSGLDRIPIELLAKKCDLRSGSYRTKANFTKHWLSYFSELPVVIDASWFGTSRLGSKSFSIALDNT